MRRSGLCLLAVAAAGVIGAPSASGSMVKRLFPPRLECASSFNLTVKVEDTAVLAGKLVPAEDLEQRILQRAMEVLAKAGVTGDPQADTIRLTAAASPAGVTSVTLAPSRDSRWESARVVKGDDEDEPATAGDVEETAIALLSEALGRKERCRPTRSASANGRFELELPPENEWARARYLEERLGTEASGGTENALWGFLIERPERGPEEVRAVIQLPPGAPGERTLVSNDGRFVVLVAHSTGGGCIRIRDFRVTILSTESGERNELRPTHFLTASDARLLSPYTGFEAQLDETRDLLAVSVPVGESVHRIEIDLATGRPIETPRNLLPPRLAQSGVYEPAPNANPVSWREPICAGPRVDFDAADLLRETPGRIYGRAVLRPVPEIPDLAQRARYGATVDVEVVVSVTGRVECARVSQVPLGLSQAVESTIRGWRFRPVEEEGQARRSIGRISFRFAL